MNLFQNSSKRHTLNKYRNYSFKSLNDFDYSKTTDFYYSIDLNANNIIVFDSNWIFQYNSSVKSPNAIKIVENEIFLTNITSLNKLSIPSVNDIQKIFNLKSSYLYSFIGLDYDKNTDSIISISSINPSIYYFDRNLVSKSVNTLNIQSSLKVVTVYKNKLYISTGAGSSILVVENGIIIDKFSNICQTGVISSISFDQYDYMTVACRNDFAVYLYYLNGTYTGYYIDTNAPVSFAKLDSKGRFIVGCTNQIDIYY